MRTTRTSTSSSWMEHEHLVVVDGVDDAVRASPSRPIPLELEPQGFPDPVWVLGKRAVEEVDHCHGHRFGQVVFDRALGPWRQEYGVPALAHGRRRLVTAART